MIDKFCMFLTNKIRKNNEEITDEKAELIYFGLQNIIGEIPKTFIIIGIAFLLGIGQLTILSFIAIVPFRSFSGGFHLKTHIGCIVSTTVMYCGTALLGKYFPLEPLYIKYIAVILVYIFALVMVTLYAPADTENIPLLRKKDRRRKKILSYITLTITLVISIIINDPVISSIIIYGMFIQSITITRLAYKITNNKYGYEVYNQEISI